MRHISEKWEKLGCSSDFFFLSWLTGTVSALWIEWLRLFHYFTGFALCKLWAAEALRTPMSTILLPQTHCLHHFHTALCYGLQLSTRRLQSPSAIPTHRLPFLLPSQHHPKQKKKGREETAFAHTPIHYCLLTQHGPKKCNCNENTTWKVNHIYTKYGLVLPLLLLFGNTYTTGWCLRCTKNKVTMSEFNLTHMLTCMQCAFSSVQISVDSLETDVKTGLWATVISLLGRIIYSGETEQTCFRACKILCSHSIYKTRDQFLSRFFPSAKCLLLIWMLFLFKLLQVIKITAFCTGRESSAARWCGLLPESTPACAQHCTFAQFPTVLSVTYPRHNLLCKENSSWVFLFVCFFPVLRSRHQHAVQISERLRHL